MSLTDQYRAEFIANKEWEWEDALGRFRDVLNSSNPKVAELARLMMTASSDSIWKVLGGASNVDTPLLGYTLIRDSMEAYMDFIARFITYEIQDNGDPALGYYRDADWENPKEASLSIVMCGPDHPDAKPYFCRNQDWLEQQFPQARRLTLDTAIEAIRFHEKERRDFYNQMVEDLKKAEETGEFCLWEPGEEECYADSDLMAERAAFCDELTA